MNRFILLCTLLVVYCDTVFAQEERVSQGVQTNTTTTTYNTITYTKQVRMTKEEWRELKRVKKAEQMAAKEEIARIKAEEKAKRAIEREEAYIKALEEKKTADETARIRAEEDARVKAEEKAKRAVEREKVYLETKAKIAAERAEAKQLREIGFDILLGKMLRWQHMVVVSIDGAGQTLQQPSISVEYVGGERFNNTLFVGFGAGLTFNTYNLLNTVSVPLYANMKVYLARRKSQPYLFLSTGMRLSVNHSYFDVFKYNPSQYFITPGIGVDFRFKSGNAISMQAGLQTITVPTLWGEYRSNGDIRYHVNHKMRCGYYFSIGYNF